MIFWDAPPNTSSVFVQAWSLTGFFWAKTLAIFAHHAGIILLYAAPPATFRAWVLLRTKPVPAWWLPSLEALLIVWRLLMCGVAVWVALTPDQFSNLTDALQSEVLIQTSLSRLGGNVGDQLWLLAWETCFFLVAFLLLSLLLSYMSKLWVQGQDLSDERKGAQTTAMFAASRNLLLVPLALIYVVVVVHHYLA
jgi:hypothetical protein